MAEPILFISRNKIIEGRGSEFRQHYLDSLPATEKNKTGTLIQLAYENDAGNEITIVRLFPDANMLDAQIQGADERSKKTYEFIQPISIEIFGTPNALTLDKMKNIAGSGVPVVINPHYLGGFIRPYDNI